MLYLELFNAISSISLKVMKSIVIFGGSGFVGKYLIRRLCKRGFRIIVPYQQSTNEAKLRQLGVTGQVIPYYFKSLNNDERLKSILLKSDVCLNLKTSWDQKKETFKNSIFKFNKNLTLILKNNKRLEHYIFFSGLGLNPKSKSMRDNAILKSEAEINKNLKNSIIIRPGVIIGGGDKFLKRLVPLFKISYFIPLFGNKNIRFQPVYIDDVSLVVDRIISEKVSGNHIFELAGPSIFKYEDFYNNISKYLNKSRILINIPVKLSKLLIWFLEKIPNFPINIEQLQLMQRDSVKEGIDKDFSFFEIIPQNTLLILKKSLFKN